AVQPGAAARPGGGPRPQPGAGHREPSQGPDHGGGLARGRGAVRDITAPCPAGGGVTAEATSGAGSVDQISRFPSASMMTSPSSLVNGPISGFSRTSSTT